MERVLEMLEALVSQGEAQFKCGDKYATFNQNFIAIARNALNTCKDSMKFTDCMDAIKKIHEDSFLDKVTKVSASAYLIGYEGALVGDSKEKSMEIISKLVGQKVTF